jgi:hypothetical protein
MTIANRMWCAACCTAVEAVVKEASASGLGAIIGSGAGALHAGSRSRPTAGEMVVRTIAYGFLGHVIESALVPAAQRLVCGTCGCSKLSALPASRI